MILDEKTDTFLDMLVHQSWDKNPREFLKFVATFLCDYLRVRYVLIDQITPHKDQLASSAFAEKGRLRKPILYNMLDTPCGSVFNKEFCFYPDNIQALFPRDDFLQQGNIESYSGIPLYGSKGKAIGLIAVMDDKPMTNRATVRKALQIVSLRVSAMVETLVAAEELEKSEADLSTLRRAIENHAIVSQTDVRGVIDYVNDAFVQISGYSEDELIGQTHAIVKSGDHDESFYKNMWDTVQGGKVWQGVFKNLSKQGKPYWVKSTIVPQFDAAGKPIKFLSIRTDISYQHQMVEEAKNALSAKQRFLSLMSHEFRTPLNTAFGYIQLMQASETDALKSDHLSEIYMSLDDILRKVNSMLYFSMGVESSAEDYNDVPLRHLVADCFATFARLSQHKKVALHNQIDENLDLYIHGEQLKLILSCLISNGIKYNKPDGCVTVSNQTNSDGDTVITVTDTGLGMPAKLTDMAVSFERGGKHFNSTTSGLGLGLTIATKFATTLGLSLYFETNDAGTIFYIGVPASKNKA